jgi:hypothetical protein
MNSVLELQEAHVSCDATRLVHKSHQYFCPLNHRMSDLPITQVLSKAKSAAGGPPLRCIPLVIYRTNMPISVNQVRHRHS